MKKRLLSLVLVIVLSLSLLSGCANSSTPSGNKDEIKVRLAIVTSPGSPYDWGAQEFKKQVEESSGGRIKVNVHAGDMVTDEIEAFGMAQSGNIEIAWIGTGAIGGFVPNIELIGMPFLFDDNDHMIRAFKGDFGKAIIEDINEVKGVVGLGFHIDGWRNILTNGRDINSIEDMKGLRIRTMMNNICVGLYEALGAVPISIPSGEIYTSLQTNVVDAQDNSVVYADSEGYIEAIKSIAVVHHYYSGGIALANENWFNELSEEDQKLITTAAEEAGAYAINKFLSEDEKLIEQYENQGYTVTYPSDIDAWKAAMEPLYEEFYAKYPEWRELVKMVDAVR